MRQKKQKSFLELEKSNKIKNLNLKTSLRTQKRIPELLKIHKYIFSVNYQHF
jgi:hypothetical protein